MSKDPTPDNVAHRRRMRIRENEKRLRQMQIQKATDHMTRASEASRFMVVCFRVENKRIFADFDPFNFTLADWEDAAKEFDTQLFDRCEKATKTLDP